jgi:hypothetical protein
MDTRFMKKKKKKRYKNTGDNPFPENGRRRRF